MNLVAESDPGSTGNLSSGSTQSQTKETKKVVKLYVLNKKKEFPEHVYNVFEKNTLISDKDTGTLGILKISSANVITNIADNFYYDNYSVGYNFLEIYSYALWQTKGHGRVNFNGTAPHPVGLNMKKDSTQKEIINAAIIDFTIGTGNYGAPPLKHYWNEEIVKTHEMFHLEHWKIVYNSELIDTLDSIVEGVTIEYLKDPNSLYSVLDNYKLQSEFYAYEISVYYFLLDAEIEAHAISNQAFQQIADTLKGNINE